MVSTVRHLKKQEYRVAEENLHKYSLPEVPEKYFWKLWDVGMAGYATIAYLELVKKTWYGRRVIGDKYIIAISQDNMFEIVPEKADEILKSSHIIKGMS